MKRFTFHVNGRTYDIHARSFAQAEAKLAALLSTHPRYP